MSAGRPDRGDRPGWLRHPEALTLFAAWQAVLSYSLQLYFDFSGYSDMAIGLALMFNLRFPLNFNSPYKAQSVVDYWQRWHMTLTRYFTQYVYQSAGGRRDAPAHGAPVADQPPGADDRAGLHHDGGGADLRHHLAGRHLAWQPARQFVVFGLLHAIYLTINRACRIFRPNPPPPTGFGSALARGGNLRVRAGCVGVLPGAVARRGAGHAGRHGWTAWPW